MKILLVHPGASVSTSDVYDGYLPAFQDLGVQIWRYNLDARINSSGAYLQWHYKRMKRAGAATPKPLPGDVLAHASQDVLAKALWNDIDWVVVVSGMYMHPDWVILLRKAGLKVAVLLTESPYDDDKQGAFVQWANLAWTNEITSVPYLRQWNPKVEYLPHAYDPAKHFPAGPHDDVPIHDVLFIGTGFIERIEMLEKVDWDGINLGLYGTWELLGSRHRLRKYIAGGYIDNTVANMMYRNAAINLNLYRTSRGFGRNVSRIEYAESLNPRALELAASGAFTISDYRPEVERVFGDAVPTVRNAHQLEDAIWFYLSHPIERQRKAAALPTLVEGHTFQAGAEKMLRDLNAYG